MFSQAKKQDKEFLLVLAEIIEYLVKTCETEALDTAEKLGDHYLQLQEKIHTYDYTKDDKMIEEINNLV